MSDAGDKKTTGIITLQTLNGESITIENNELLPDTYDRFKLYVMEKCGIQLDSSNATTLLIVSNGVLLDSTNYKKPNLTENEHYILMLTSNTSFESETSHNEQKFDCYGDNTDDSDNEDNENDDAYTLKDLEIIEEKVLFKDTEAGKFVAKLAKKIVASSEYPPLPEIPQEYLQGLMEIGLSENRARNALLKNRMRIDEASNYAFDHFGDPEEDILITPREYAEMMGRMGVGPRVCSPAVLVEYFAKRMKGFGLPVGCIPTNVKVSMNESSLNLLDDVLLKLELGGIDNVISAGPVQSAIKGFLEDPLNFVPDDEQIEIFSPYIEKVVKKIRLN